MANTTIIMKGPFQPNSPPVITSTPNPSFTEGTAATHNMSQHFSDDGVTTVTTSLPPGGAHPSGISYNGNTHILTYDGAGAATSYQRSLSVDDGVNDPVVSDEFTIEIVAGAASFGVTQTDPGYLTIIPGIRGFGTDTVGGSGRHLGTPTTTVLYVNSLSTANSGSGDSGTLLWCLSQPFPRTIIPAISGLIEFPADHIFQITEPFMTYAGQCAPGVGLHVYSTNPRIFASDVFMDHHSMFMGDATGQGSGNNLQVGGGGNSVERVVIANCNFFFGWDGNYLIFNNSSSTTTDVTFWQNLSAMGQLDAFGNGSHISLQPGMRATVARQLCIKVKRRNMRINRGTCESFNNFGYDNDFNMEHDPIGDGATTIMNLQNNAAVSGPNGQDSQGSFLLFEDSGGVPPFWSDGGYWCITGNRKFSDFVNALDVDNSTGDPIQTVPHADAISPGRVMRTIADSDAEIIVFANVMSTHCGAWPDVRLSYVQNIVDEMLDYLNGGADSVARIGNPADAGWPITIASTTINHETTGSHGVAAIPSASTRDDVMASGYTRLEEWLHAHRDFVMGTTGWRL
jgi:hypothetical protein